MSTTQQITDRSAQWVRHNYNELQEFPRQADGDWIGKDLPDGLHSVFRQALDRGLIKCTGFERYGEGRQRHTRNTYRTSSKLDAIRDTIEDRDTLPCGHTGFSKVGDDTYQCCADHCTQTHDRETVAEVYL